MDIKVYHKETVSQPSGSIDVLEPDIIDIYPQFDTSGNSLEGCDTVEGDEETLQEVVVATIWQRGLDPIDSEDGVQWAEAILGEVTVPQIITELQDAVSEVSETSSIEFSTVTGTDGKEHLTYTVKAV